MDIPDLHPQDRTLFKGRLLWVLDYRCDGTAQGQEEFPAQHEIVLPRAGAFLRRDALGTSLADPVQILFFNRQQPYEVSHPLAVGDRSTVFILEPSLLLEIIAATDPAVEERLDTPFLRNSVAADTRLRSLQYALIRMGKDSPLLEPLQVEEQVIYLLSQLLQATLVPTGMGRRRSSPATLRQHTDLVEAVKVLLNARYPENLLLEEIAASVYASPYHLCRTFKQVTGMSIHQYQKRLRLFNALELLSQEPGSRLDRLALDLGFSHHSHFATAFRQAFGFSPSDLRQMSKILQA